MTHCSKNMSELDNLAKHAYLWVMSKVIHRDSCKCNENPEEWRVAAPEYHNCFFTYMRHNARPHTLNEISKLLGVSIAAVTAIEKKASVKMKRRISELEKVKKLKGT